jgi:small subunit ribosomal protein S21
MPKLRGRSVIVQDGNVEKALRKFKKKIQEMNLLNELRDRESYTKPTTARKLKASAAKNRWRKKIAQQQLPKKLY